MEKIQNLNAKKSEFKCKKFPNLNSKKCQNANAINVKI